MSATILDGRKTREALIPGLIKKIEALPRAPTLVIIQVGERPDSTAFIQAKRSFAKQIGVNEKYIKITESAMEEDVIGNIKDLNDDLSIGGIIVQLPLPSHMDSGKVIEAIDPKKDVDGLIPFNIKDLSNGNTPVMSATARGIKELLAFNKIELKGKIVVVVGKSALVGQPIAIMCSTEGAQVIVCDSKTEDLVAETKKADILITAVGSPKLITREHVKSGQVVIDVGITRSIDSGLIGDVDFESVKDIVSAITPVPGGVGPMTVLALFENLVDLAGK